MLPNFSNHNPINLISLALYYFLIYVNDLPMFSKFLKLILFLDDTNIFFTDKRIDYCFEIFNTELINLSEWF